MFKFELCDVVCIERANLKGSVIGRAEYTEESNLYLLSYVDKQGNPQESWFKESDLVYNIQAVTE